MTKCENCYHSDVCADYNKTHSIDWEPDCKYLKDKSLIAELPCKIGDTVYILNRVFCACVTPEVNYYEILEEKVRMICIGKSEIRMESKRLDWGVSDFGKTVFFTREDAEKALNAQNAV